MGKGLMGSGSSGRKSFKDKHKNISKKVSDHQRKVKDHHKSQAKETKIAEKKKQFEVMKLQKRKGLTDKREELKKRAEAIRKGKNPDLETNDWEDVDEHEKDVFDKDGYFDVMENEQAISKSDETILQTFTASKTSLSGPSKIQKEASAGGSGQTLADLIMQKMNAGTLEEDVKVEP